MTEVLATTGVEAQSEPFSTTIHLEQNYPNPFNPTTVMSYELPVTCSVKLAVYDMLGREMAVLVNEEKPAGRHTVTWESRTMASGLYFYRLQAGAFVETKKLVLAK